MNGPRVEETREEKAIRVWLARSAPGQAPASLRETLESVTATRPGSRRPRLWLAGRAASLVGAAAAVVILAVVVASVFTYSRSPIGQSSPMPSSTASSSTAPTPTSRTAPGSHWRLVVDQLPSMEGEASPGGPTVFARPEGGFVAFVLRQDKDFNPESDVLTSSDGSVWTMQSTVPGSVEAVAYSGDMAVAVGCSNYGGAGSGTNSFEAWTTSDFKTWQSAILPAPSGDLECVSGLAVGPAGYLAWTFAQSASPDLMWRSADGTSWQRVTAAGLPWNASVLQLISVSGGYAIEGFLGDRAATWFSPDGVTWTQAWTGPAPLGYEYYRLGPVLEATGGGYVSFGSVDETSRLPVWTSQDGLHWTLSQTLSQSEAPGQGRLASVGKGPNGYVAAAGGSIDTATSPAGPPRVWTSTDGRSWQPETLPAAVSTMSADLAWVVSDGTYVVIVCVIHNDNTIFLLVE
ncbi:MAG: hypothetical protein ABSE70_00890 [Candidatus Limnocylindrales bacterium]